MREPRNYQSKVHTTVVKKLNKGVDRMMVVLPTGCHAKGTGIIMYDGSIKLIEDITSDDLIMGNDSTPRKVLKLIRGNEMMWKISPVKGDPFIVNQNHILSLKPTGKDYSEIVNISVNDYRGKSNYWKHCHKLYRTGIKGNTIMESPTLGYWIGLWLGDGTFSRPNITNPDQEVAKFFWDEFDEYCKVYTNPRVRINKLKSKDRCDVYSFTTDDGESNPILDLIKTLYINDEKRIDHKRLTSHVDYRLQLLAGLIDSDGYIDRGGCEIITKYSGLRDDILFLARSLGFAAYSSIKIGKIKSINFEGVYYRIYISGDLSIIPCKVLRKQVKPRKQKKNVLVTGFKIEPVLKDDFYGFELDDNHLYLTDDFTVHHNSGKTFTACGLIDIIDSKRTLWLTHREELIDQSGAALAMTICPDPIGIEKYLESSGGLYNALNRLDSTFASDDLDVFLKKNIGVIKQKRMDVNARIVVASVQTLWRRLEQLDPNTFDFIIIDECHLAIAKTWVKCVDYFKTRLRLGLTATPTRMDGLSLYSLFDEIVYKYELNQAIQDGWLVEIDGIRCKTTIDLDSVHTRAGEFMTGELSNVVDCPERNNYIVDKYLEYGHNRQAIFYCVDIKHAQHLAETFFRRGIKSVEVVVSNEEITPDRKTTLRKFKNGEIQILTNVDILTTGFDYPNLSIIGTACPTKSTVKYIQTVGRGTRPIASAIRGIKTASARRKAIKRSEKPVLTLLDFVDVTSKHSLVNAFELDKGKDPDARAFITEVKRDKLNEARRLKEEEKLRREIKIEGMVAKDQRVNLVPLPEVKISSSPKMREPATQKQIAFMQIKNLYNPEVSYTKGDAAYLLSNTQISDSRIKTLIQEGFDAKADTTLGEFNEALKIITERREKKRIMEGVVLPVVTKVDGMPQVFKVKSN